MVGVLPSLGFIGTVIGMSDALLKANTLFDSVDKTGAISDITNRLGFAFDTTLVGLVAIIITGSIVLILRKYEGFLWRSARKFESAG